MRLQDVVQTVGYFCCHLGVGVVIEAVHECMTTRGVHKPGVTMLTSCLLGNFQDTSGNSLGVSFCHQFEGQVLIPSARVAPPVTGACFSQLNGMSADGRRG
jgi:hypothetical protein